MCVNGTKRRQEKLKQAHGEPIRALGKQEVLENLRQKGPRKPPLTDSEDNLIQPTLSSCFSLQKG